MKQDNEAQLIIFAFNMFYDIDAVRKEEYMEKIHDYKKK